MARPAHPSTSSLPSDCPARSAPSLRALRPADRRPPSLPSFTKGRRHGLALHALARFPFRAAPIPRRAIHLRSAGGALPRAALGAAAPAHLLRRRRAVLADGDRSVTAVVCLVRYTPNDREGYVFGYKDMDESMGPVESECPEVILDLLTPTDGAYALAWRARCRANAERRRKRSAKPRPRPGQTIVFDQPLVARDGRRFDRLVAVANSRSPRTLLFRDLEGGGPETSGIPAGGRLSSSRQGFSPAEGVRRVAPGPFSLRLAGCLADAVEPERKREAGRG